MFASVLFSVMFQHFLSPSPADVHLRVFMLASLQEVRFHKAESSMPVSKSKSFGIAAMKRLGRNPKKQQPTSVVANVCERRVCCVVNSR